MGPETAGVAAGHSMGVLSAAQLSHHASGVDLTALFRLALQKGASDIHLVARMPPVLRVNGALIKTDAAALAPDEAKRLIYSLLTDQQRAEFERELELDVSFGVAGIGRFRVNVHLQRGSVEAAFRLIPSTIRSITELGLPPVVQELARAPNGLVLVTGPAGVGKSTTLAAMIDLISTERSALVITVEDPIEYLYQHKRAVVKQREVFADTKSFAAALRHALRQDPNVIVVGELRDLETMATALTAAETGHLVLATLHTPDAPQTIHRIIDVFPPHQQQQVTIQLADGLQGIISQQLLPSADGTHRVAACEVLLATTAVRHLIRERAIHQLATVMQTGGHLGMCTMDASLKALSLSGAITHQTALRHAKHPHDLEAPRTRS